MPDGGLVKLSIVGGGDYARFLKYISPMFIGGLAIFGWWRGLDKVLADGEQLRVVSARGMGGSRPRAGRFLDR